MPAREPPWRNTVGRERLQDARRPQDAAQGRGESGSPYACGDQGSIEGNIGQEIPTTLIDQGGTVDAVGQEDGQGDVDHEADSDRRHRPARNRALGILEVTRHVDPRGKPGHGGEEDAKEDFQRGRPWRTLGHDFGRHWHRSTKKHGHQRGADQCEDEILGLDRKGGGDQRDNGERGDGDRARDPNIILGDLDVRNGQEALTEADHIQADAEREPEKERHTQGPSDRQA